MKGKGANHLAINFRRLEIPPKKLIKKSVTGQDMNQVRPEYKPQS
jgi:hypothetical protein